MIKGADVGQATSRCLPRNADAGEASQLEKIPQPRDFNNMFRRQDGADQIRLRSGVDFIQMLLGSGSGNEVLDALVESAVNDQIRPCAGRGAGTFAVDRRPFSQGCGSTEIYLKLFIRHPCRLARLPS